MKYLTPRLVIRMIFYIFFFQVTHKEVFIKELKSSLNFFQLQKPVLRNPSRAPSLASSNNEKLINQATENLLDFEKDIQ